MKLSIENSLKQYIFITAFYLLNIASPVLADTINVTIEGVISPSANDDIYQLDNANFSAIFTYDTEATPIFASSSSGAWITSFPYVSSNIIFSNRPSGALDATTFISPTSSSQLSIRNSFAPSTVLDLVRFGGELTGEFQGLNMDILFVFDQQYFQAATIANLSDFDLLDGTPSAGGSLFFSLGAIATPFHRVTTFSNISVAVVPIPSSIILFLSGIAVLRLTGKNNNRNRALIIHNS